MEVVIQAIKHFKIRLFSNISKEHQCILDSLVGQCTDRFSLLALHLVLICQLAKEWHQIKVDQRQVVNNLLSNSNKCKMVKHLSMIWLGPCKPMHLVILK